MDIVKECDCVNAANSCDGRIGCKVRKQMDKAVDVIVVGQPSHAINVESLLNKIEQLEKDAARYQYLRNADIDAVNKGGIFAGQTPENLVINGQDLDDVIDKALSKLEDES